MVVTRLARVRYLFMRPILTASNRVTEAQNSCRSWKEHWSTSWFTSRSISGTKISTRARRVGAMKSMSMGSECLLHTNLFRVGLCLIIAFALFGCAKSSSERGAPCSHDPVAIIQAASSDSALSAYGGDGWGSSRINVLWDGDESSSSLPLCEANGGRFQFVKSSSYDRTSPFIAIEKLYFDDDAAFMEIGFPPTGKNADVFLRKEEGVWRVKKTHLWEN